MRRWAVRGAASSAALFVIVDRTLIRVVILAGLKRRHPEMFDGHAASLAVRRVIEDEIGRTTSSEDVW